MPVIYLIIFLFFSRNDLLYAENDLVKANQSYQQGEIAKTLLERQLAFNSALNLYLKLDRDLTPNQTDHLKLRIGDTFFQLSEYAWAILYYHKALEINPRNQQVLKHLQLAQEKLGIPSTVDKLDGWSTFLSFSGYFSLSQRLEIFFWLISFLLILSVLYLFFPSLKFFLIGLGIFSFFVFFNLILSIYFSPIEAILISPTGLYRQPDLIEAQLSTQPLLEGLKVKIIDVQNNGYWLKIETPERLIGYVPAESVRFIQNK